MVFFPRSLGPSWPWVFWRRGRGTRGRCASATVECARCHNHKFDPISQQEYDGLQAVFAATDKANRAYDPDPAVHRQRRALLKQKDALAGREASFLVALRVPALQKELAGGEKSLSHVGV